MHLLLVSQFLVVRERIFTPEFLELLRPWASTLRKTVRCTTKAETARARIVTADGFILWGVST